MSQVYACILCGTSHPWKRDELGTTIIDVTNVHAGTDRQYACEDCYKHSVWEYDPKLYRNVLRLASDEELKRGYGGSAFIGSNDSIFFDARPFLGEKKC